MSAHRTDGGRGEAGPSRASTRLHLQAFLPVSVSLTCFLLGWLFLRQKLMLLSICKKKNGFQKCRASNPSIWQPSRRRHSLLPKNSSKSATEGSPRASWSHPLANPRPNSYHRWDTGLWMARLEPCALLKSGVSVWCRPHKTEGWASSPKQRCNEEEKEKWIMARYNEHVHYTCVDPSGAFPAEHLIVYPDRNLWRQILPLPS